MKNGSVGFWVCLQMVSIAVACQPTQGTGRARSNPPELKISLPAQLPPPLWVQGREMNSAQPLDGLIEACARTEGAVFEPLTSTCECDDHEGQSRVFVPRSIGRPALGGSCVSIDLFAVESNSDESWQHRVGGTSITAFLLSQGKTQGSFKDSSEGVFLKVRAWNPFFLAGSGEMVGISIGDEPLLVNQAQEQGLPLDQYSQLFDYEPPIVFNDDPQLAFNRIKIRLFHAAGPDELPATLGSVRLGRDSLDTASYELTIPPRNLNLSKIHEQDLNAAKEAYSSYLEWVLHGHGRTSDSKESFEKFSDEGCLGFCRSAKDLVLPETLRQLGHQAVELRTISQGTLAHHVLRIQGPGNRLSGTEALILLNRAGILSAVALLESVETEKKQQIEIRIFDRAWHELTPRNSELKPVGGKHLLEASPQPKLDPMVQVVSENATEWKSVLRNESLGLRQLKRGDRPIVVCEDQFSPDRLVDRGLASSVYIGERTDSLYGWLSPKDPSGDVDAWVFLNPIGETGWNDRRRNDHSLMVSKALLDTGPSSRVIPISTRRCLDLTAGEFSLLARKQARVINVSFIESLDDGVCGELYGKAIYSKSKDSQLWVLGAGNDGKNKDTATRVWLCPQSYLSGRDNSIVVAGLKDGRLWRDSNFGEHFADIVADVSLGSSFGTSFAAPRVSGVAAEIFGRFPLLTPQKVRLAILISADIPLEKSENTILLNTFPVRSGGILNPQKALRAAKMIANTTSFSSTFLIKFISDLHCTSSDSEKECFGISQARYDLLKRTNIVE